MPNTYHRLTVGLADTRLFRANFDTLADAQAAQSLISSVLYCLKEQAAMWIDEVTPVPSPVRSLTDLFKEG